jgi:hypothetical protein
LILTVTSPAARIANKAVMGVWLSLELVGRFCVCAYGGSLASVAVTFKISLYREFVNSVFSILFVKIMLQFTVFLFVTKKDSLPSTLTGYTALVCLLLMFRDILPCVIIFLTLCCYHRCQVIIVVKGL